MKTIAIFGAGPALGLAVAHRFGREGYQVALVARGRDHLDELVGELTRDGITAKGFQADLTDRAAALAAIDAIEAELGPVDVLEYSPTPGVNPGTSPSQVAADMVAPLLDKFVLTPIALAGRVLPGMLKRGDGGLLFPMGAAAKYPMPRMVTGGVALAALRNYVHALHAEVAPQGVYAGTLLIGAVIEGSAAHRNAAAWGNGQVPVLKADDLAGLCFDLYSKRDRVEDQVTPGMPTPAGA
jgi:NADP-dependent 3-hydroxy acid dehydrogenase YdfG